MTPWNALTEATNHPRTGDPGRRLSSIASTLKQPARSIESQIRAAVHDRGRL